MDLNKLFDYKGNKKNKNKNNYFEGWFIKIVDPTVDCAYSFIFGISTNHKDPHAFIQIIDSKNKCSKYLRYELSSFKYDIGVIKIEDSYLTPDKMVIEDKDALISCEIKLSNHIKIERNIFNDSVMSYFNYLPLECFHEIVFLKAEFSGYVAINDSYYDLNGIAYMEKDMGTNFPSQYFWLQTNHFSKQNANLVLAIAEIPLRKKSIRGFFCIFELYNRQYRFASYNNAKINFIRVADDRIEISISKAKIRLEFFITPHDFYSLKGPKQGLMETKVDESLNSTMTFALYEDNVLMFKDSANYVAIENSYGK